MTVLPRLKATSLALILLGCAVFALAAPAYADKGGKGKGHDDHARGQQQHEAVYDRDSKSWLEIAIGDDDRNDIRRYLQNDYQRHCPPGLAKKHNGCLPPGQAKKYRIGDSLPGGVNYSPIPRDLRDLLGPVPRGYQYVQVDKDVLLISEASKKVIDVVTLLSAVGN